MFEGHSMPGEKAASTNSAVAWAGEPPPYAFILLAHSKVKAIFLEGSAHAGDLNEEPEAERNNPRDKDKPNK